MGIRTKRSNSTGKTYPPKNSQPFTAGDSDQISFSGFGRFSDDGFPFLDDSDVEVYASA